jgi:hypothetical protein
VQSSNQCENKGLRNPVFFYSYALFTNQRIFNSGTALPTSGQVGEIRLGMTALNGSSKSAVQGSVVGIHMSRKL